jgi:hypothetical protein
MPPPLTNGGILLSGSMAAHTSEGDAVVVRDNTEEQGGAANAECKAQPARAAVQNGGEGMTSLVKTV